MNRHHDKLAYLTYLGLLMGLPLTSCSRVTAKADAAAIEAVPVRTVRAVSQDVPLEISAVGNVEAMESVAVKSRIAGQINRIAFEEGQSVNKGQLLFTIDRDVLERQAMEQQARAVVARDAASQKQSESEADVAMKLESLGVISGQRANQLMTTRDTAHAALESDQAAVEAAVGATKADKARLAQTQLQLSFTQVVAPIAGRAGAAMVKTGNVVRDNDTTLVSILQLAPINVTFGIPEQSLSEVQRLNAGGHLVVEASHGDGATYEGHLVFIDNTVDATTGTIRLKAAFLNADGALWPGEFINLRLRLRVDKGQIIIPESSIQDGLDGKYAWLVKSGVANMVPVTVLRIYKPQNSHEQAVIGSGIHPGDMIVTEGQLRLTPGVRVSLLDTPRLHSPSDNDKTAQ